MAALLGASAATPPPQGARISVEFDGLRSAKGAIIACVTSRADLFPKCERDPAARHQTIAAPARAMQFDALPAGNYAVAVIHDENGNGRLDTMMGIPREGYGFSRNAAVRMGPPRFREAALTLTANTAHDERIAIRYLL